VVVEPDEFVPFVLGEAVLVEEIEGVVPLAVDAEVEDAHAEAVRDIGEVVLWKAVHADFNTESHRGHGATRNGDTFLA
jgi:hypothetical protein